MIVELRKAIKNTLTLVLVDKEGRERLVEPYAVHKGKSDLLLHCYQIYGNSLSGASEGWKNIRLNDIKALGYRKLFDPRPEYNYNKFANALLKMEVKMVTVKE